MERDRTVPFSPVDHPDARVRRVGFDRTDPYVEQCWSAVIGPSSTLLLPRLPMLWVASIPAEVNSGGLSRSFGLGGGEGECRRVASTLERLSTLGLARLAPDHAGLDVYRQVHPLTQREFARLPEWTHDAKDRLLGAHLTRIEDTTRHRTNVVSITARPDGYRHNTDPHLSGRTYRRSAHRTLGLTRRPGSPGTPVSRGAHVGAERRVQRSHVDRFPCGKPVGRPVGGVR